VAIVRIEQIAPLPYVRVQDQLKLYPNATVCWAQEEHRNQGAWGYVKDKMELILERTGRPTEIRYIGRKVSGSTAVGSLKTHKQQLEDLLSNSFN